MSSDLSPTSTCRIAFRQDSASGLRARSHDNNPPTAAGGEVELHIGRGLDVSPRRRCAGVPVERRASTTPQRRREISEVSINVAARRCITSLDAPNASAPPNHSVDMRQVSSARSRRRRPQVAPCPVDRRPTVAHISNDASAALFAQFGSAMAQTHPIDPTHT
jgi:hypothetical protein